MYLTEKINSNFSSFSHRISKILLFWVAGMILEAWDVELEGAYFLCLDFVCRQCEVLTGNFFILDKL